MAERRTSAMTRSSAIAIVVLTVSVNVAVAGPKPADTAKPVFGSRTENPDGSVKMTVGRELPMAWHTRIGTDVRLAAPAGIAPADDILMGRTDGTSSGAVWGSVAIPGASPLGWDTVVIEGRLDADSEQGKVGASLSRSLPLGDSLSVTLQQSYSVTRSLAGGSPGLAESQSAVAHSVAAAPVLNADQSVRLKIASFGTTVSAAANASSADDQWHSRLSMEQTLFGPLKVTTSVFDAGSTSSSKSISAGFKHSW